MELGVPLEDLKSMMIRSCELTLVYYVTINLLIILAWFKRHSSEIIIQ